MQTEAQLQAGTIQNEANQFVETILKRSESLSLNDVSQADKVTNNTFELFGNLAYLLGLGFTKMEHNETNIRIVIERFKKLKVKSQTLKKAIEIIKNTDMSVFNEGKEYMKNYINTPIEKNYNFKNKIISIINSSLVPIPISKHLSDRFINNVDEQMNYHDLLIFSNTFYEELVLPNTASNLYIQLTKDPQWKILLKLASDYFEFQKYALIYNENIVYLKEFLDKFEDIKDLNFIFEAIDMNFDSEESYFEYLKEGISHYVIKTIEPINEAEIVKEENILDDLENDSEVDYPQPIPDEIFSNPQKEIKEFLINVSEAFESEGMTFDVSTLDGTANMLEELLINDDTEVVGSFYQYLKQIRQNQQKSGDGKFDVKAEEMFNVSTDELLEYFQSRIQINQDLYKDFNTNYLAEIKEVDQPLVNKVNDLISIIYITGAKEKTLLLSQLSQNCIFTYKHLHEILVAIEKQFIPGSNILMYESIYSELENKHEDTYNMFKNSSLVEQYELKIKLLLAFKNVFKTETENKD